MSTPMIPKAGFKNLKEADEYIKSQSLRGIFSLQVFKDVVEYNNQLAEEKESYKKESERLALCNVSLTTTCDRLLTNNEKLRERIKELGPHGGWGGK